MSTSSDQDQRSLLLEQISVLYSTFTPADFLVRLEGMLQVMLGTVDFSLVASGPNGPVCSYSSRIPELTERLEPTPVSQDQLAALNEQPPTTQTPGALVVDSVTLPVDSFWRLGAGGDNPGFLLFHEACERAAELPDEVLSELKRATSLAFFKIQDRQSALATIDQYQAKLQAINEVGELLGTLDINVLLTKLMELSLYVVNAQVGSIILAQDDDSEPGVEWGLPLEMASSFQGPEGVPVFEQVLASGEPALILDFGASSEHRIVGLDVQVGSYLCVPLISQGRTLGVINLVRPPDQDASFSELDRDILMTISGLAATSIANAMLHADSLEKERYRQSLSIARNIQMKLFPSSAPPFPGLDIAWSTESCDETGGDYVDFISHESGRLLAVVGDVSGHGIGSALLMAAARAGLRASTFGQCELSRIIARLNDQLEQDMELDRFMTMFVAALDPGTNEITFVNAGHDSPLIYRAATGAIEELPSTGMPLGIFAGNQFETGSTKGLEPGDVLLITTDGVWEVNAASGGEMLGKERMQEIFAAHAGRDARGIIEGIMTDVTAYTGGGAARDDVTLVVLRAEG